MDIVTNHSTTELGHPSNYLPMSSICGGWHRGNFEHAGHLLSSFSLTLCYSLSPCVISARVSLSLMKKWKQTGSEAAPRSLHLCFSVDSGPQTASSVWCLYLLLFPSSTKANVSYTLCLPRAECFICSNSLQSPKLHIGSILLPVFGKWRKLKPGEFGKLFEEVANSG